LVAEEILFKFMVREDCEKDFLAEKEKRSSPLKIRATGLGGHSSGLPKRQRTGAFSTTLRAVRASPDNAPASWTAAALRRF
jgi:hypothetical protein